MGWKFLLDRVPEFMPSPNAVPIELSQRQRDLLEKIVRKRSNPHRLVQRSQVVLMAARGINNTAISQKLNLHRHQVRNWRNRWLESHDDLNNLEQQGVSEGVLSQHIVTILSDKARPGGPATFEVEQIVEIVAVACEPPAHSTRPISHWTPRELAAEVVKRGIVPSISSRSVGRFLKRSDVAAPSKSLLAQPLSEKPSCL